MAEPTYVSLAVLHTEWLSSAYGLEASKLLSGQDIPRVESSRWRDPSLYRHLGFLTPGGWFIHKLMEIQQLSGIGGLAFLRGECVTHTHESITRDNAGEVVCSELQYYSVLSLDWAAEIESLRALESWCAANAAQAGDVLEVPGDWIAPAIETRFYSLKPSSEGLGDGYGHEFFFSMLHTITELLRFARHCMDCWKIPNVWVVYHTA